MPRRNANHGRGGLIRGAFLWALLSGAAPLASQELSLQRDYPGSGPYQCPALQPIAERTAEERAQAAQLASDANEAVILGEYLRAADLLSEASQLDPSSAEFAYLSARNFETLGLPEEAMPEYCRAVALGAADIGIMDSQSRLDALDEVLRARFPQAARTAFSRGVTQADLGLYGTAVNFFTEALAQVPAWPEAVYNRAIVLERMGLMEESLEDYRLYLSLRPNDVDPVVALVAERIGTLEGLRSVPTPSPGNTLTYGMLFPGMGQYYSGRASTGTIVLGAVVGAVAAGLMVKEITVRCLNPAGPGGDCAPADIVDESTSRPYLTPAIGLAVAVSLAGAVEAYVRARRRRAEQEAAAAADQVSGFRLSGPSLQSSGDRVDLSFMTLRFR